MKNARFYYSVPTVTVTVEKIDYPEFDVDDITAYYSQTMKPTARMTICSVLNDAGDTLSFGVALCSEKDRFVKKIGRELAYNRAINNPIRTLPVTKETISMVRKAACEELEADVWMMNPKKF